MPKRSRPKHPHLLNCWYLYDEQLGYHTLNLHIDDSLHYYQGISPLSKTIECTADWFGCGCHVERHSLDFTTITVEHHEDKAIDDFRRSCRLAGVYFKKERI